MVDSSLTWCLLDGQRMGGAVTASNLANGPPKADPKRVLVASAVVASLFGWGGAALAQDDSKALAEELANPLAAPVVATSSLFAFLLAWDEFFYALLFTSDQRAKTLTVAIADLAGGRVSDYGLIATAGVLAALPPVLIGLVMQRALISGLTSGGVKG